ncbi:MAG TPA: cysteine desulfurase-like protein [Verrucomicrobiae bacterium]|nr:cysteine desulfurase-like protein [Verrucomicrobiae bacterium]
MSTFDPQTLRRMFPALDRVVNGSPAIFLDGPGGTQVPECVIEAVSEYYRHFNSNTDGAFQTSQVTDGLIAKGRSAMAALVNAPSPGHIKFAASMTAHTFAISRSIGATLGPQDEIVVTALDHEANVTPWHLLTERGVRVVTVDIDPEQCTLDMADFERKLSSRTRVVAVGVASNAVGTINDVAGICARAHAVGAIAYVDAVHYVPHGPIDVQAMECDALVCSAYKFFGPHIGVLWIQDELVARLPPYKVRPAVDPVELGTMNHEGIVGATAAIGYLESIGTTGLSQPGELQGESRTHRLRVAMEAIRAYEATLCKRLLEGLAKIPRVKVWGIADPARVAERTPTVAITVAGLAPRVVAEKLGREGIFVWDGDFYARALIERLGLGESGGVVRLGLVHYNTAEEVDRTVATLCRLADRG